MRDPVAMDYEIEAELQAARARFEFVDQVALLVFEKLIVSKDSVKFTDAALEAYRAAQALWNERKAWLAKPEKAAHERMKSFVPEVDEGAESPGDPAQLIVQKCGEEIAGMTCDLPKGHTSQHSGDSSGGRCSWAVDAASLDDPTQHPAYRAGLKAGIEKAAVVCEQLSKEFLPYYDVPLKTRRQGLESGECAELIRALPEAK